MPSQPPQVDVQAFEREVLKALTDITTFQRSGGRRRKAAAKRKPAGKGAGGPRPTRGRISETRKHILYQWAQARLKNKTLLKHVCAGLKAVTTDFSSVAKKLVAVLVPLSIAGTIVIPLDPYLYAMLAFVICKFGVDALCAGVK